MSIKNGTLFVVATPIGNLEDMTPRARRILAEVAVITAEDTRHSAGLLRHFGIRTPMQALHEHNERKLVPRLLARLAAGADIALICDAGTPLISDPGYHLVRAARHHDITVVPVPGANAAVAALSAAGLPTDRFVFEGFLPAKSAARRQRLQALSGEPRTLVFYESSHRILSSLMDMAEVLGGGREAGVARELTKQFEAIHTDTLEGLTAWIQADPDRQRGEFVVLVRGREKVAGAVIDRESERVLKILLQELPLKQAAALAAKLTGIKKNALYERGLALAKAEK